MCDFKYNTVQRSKALFQMHVHVIEKLWNNIMEGSSRKSKSSECIEKIIGHAFKRPSKIKICMSRYQSKKMLLYQKKKEIVKLSKVLDIKKCLRNNDITSKNRRISKMYNRSNTARWKIFLWLTIAMCFNFQTLIIWLILLIKFLPNWSMEKKG